MPCLKGGVRAHGDAEDCLALCTSDVRFGLFHDKGGISEGKGGRS